MMRRKYGNNKIEIDGKTFDSKKEGARYTVLKSLEKAGKISNLQTQVKFDLIPTIKHEGKTLKKIIYKADFVYEMNGEQIVEDTKGFATDVFKIKMRLFLMKYGSSYVFKIT